LCREKADRSLDRAYYANPEPQRDFRSSLGLDIRQWWIADESLAWCDTNKLCPSTGEWWSDQNRVIKISVEIVGAAPPPTKYLVGPLDRGHVVTLRYTWRPFPVLPEEDESTTDTARDVRLLSACRLFTLGGNHPAPHPFTTLVSSCHRLQKLKKVTSCNVTNSLW